MSANTKIEWADHTVNPWIGCGRRGDRRTWEADIRRIHPQAHTCCPDRKLVPARPRVFCASLSDVFDNEVPGQWRQHLMSLIACSAECATEIDTKRKTKKQSTKSTKP